MENSKMQKVLAEFHPNVAYLSDKYLLSQSHSQWRLTSVMEAPPHTSPVSLQDFWWGSGLVF